MRDALACMSRSIARSRISQSGSSGLSYLYSAISSPVKDKGAGSTPSSWRWKSAHE
jgi:hypothetical protein